MNHPSRRQPKLLFWVAPGIAVVALGLSFWVFPVSPTEEAITATATLLFIAVSSELLALKITESGSTTSMDFIPQLAAILLLGPAPAGIITLISWFIFQQWLLKNPPRKVAFNTAQVTVAVIVAGAFYSLLADPSVVPTGLSADPSEIFQPYTEFLRHSIPPFIGASLLYFAVNYSSVSYVIARTEERDFNEALQRLGGANILLFDIATSFLAFGVVFLYVEWGPLALVLTLVPIIGLRYSYGLVIELRQLNTDLLRVLINTLEAQDPYTSGHSIRVAEMAKRIARELGLDPSEVQDIETAALLHDIGKIGNAYHEILRQEDPLSDDQQKLIKEHPERGVEIVRSVRSMDESVLTYIRHHHEHYDGSGYPDGLSGEDIPLGARIIMVSDTIDAMQTTRPYREALPIEVIKTELEEQKGRQFDPVVIDAAIRIGLPETLEQAEKYRARESPALRSTAG